MSHDDGDWDSEVGSGLIDIVGDLGVGGWLGLLILLSGIGLLLWHYYYG